MPKVKYYGPYDRRVIPAGSNWGGNLAEPIKRELVFDEDNYFVIDTDDCDLTKEQVRFLLSEPHFEDVTALKVYEPNRHQMVDQGLQGLLNEKGNLAEDVAEGTAPPVTVPVEPEVTLEQPPEDANAPKTERPRRAQ